MNLKLILSFAVLALLSSCKKDDASSSAQTITPAAISATVSSGTWRVTYFFDNSDQTAHFTGYAFSFSAGGVLTGVNGGTTVTGSWSSGTDDSQVKLFLNFTTPANFSELSNDWHVTARTDSKITMEDVSGGGGGTHFLTFEKN